MESIVNFGKWFCHAALFVVGLALALVAIVCLFVNPVVAVLLALPTFVVWEILEERG